MKATETKAVCGRCGGSKRFAVYGHVANGVCFACAGTGVVDVKVSSVQTSRQPVGMSSERAQLNLRGMLAGARREGAEWLEGDEDQVGRLASTLRAANEDVRAKAMPLFAAALGGNAWRKVERALQG